MIIIMSSTLSSLSSEVGGLEMVKNQFLKLLEFRKQLLLKLLSQILNKRIILDFLGFSGQKMFKNQFLAITQKIKVSKLSDAKSFPINIHAAVILSSKPSS